MSVINKSVGIVLRKKDDMDHPYAKILDLPRPEPKSRPRMARLKRAALFAPFAALTGHERAVRDREHRTEERPILSEHMIDRLDQRLRVLTLSDQEDKEIHLEFFKKDPFKVGGEILKIKGMVDKIDLKNRKLHMQGGQIISLDNILVLEGDFFDSGAYDRVRDEEKKKGDEERCYGSDWVEE